MSKVLPKALLTALVSLVLLPQIYSFSKESEPRQMKYEYFVETDLSRDMFSDAFCRRLEAEHNWVQVKSKVEADDTYTATFRFKDEDANNWKCEVQIKDITAVPTGLPRKMDILMTMIPVLDS
jgi:uncharacterized iron-regulated membrane protein